METQAQNQGPQDTSFVSEQMMERWIERGHYTLDQDTGIARPANARQPVYIWAMMGYDHEDVCYRILESAADRQDREAQNVAQQLLDGTSTVEAPAHLFYSIACHVRMGSAGTGIQAKIGDPYTYSLLPA